MKTIPSRAVSPRRQPMTPKDPLVLAEASTSEVPPRGWSSGLRVRRHGGRG